MAVKKFYLVREYLVVLASMHLSTVLLEYVGFIRLSKVLSALFMALAK